MTYGNPAAGFPANAMPGEPVTPSQVPRAISGRRQPSSGGKKVTVKVKSHVRTITRPAQPAPTADPTAALLEAATRLRYGGQEQALGQQLNQNARFTSGVPTWYQNALAEIKGLQTQGQQQSAQTLAQVQNYNSQPTLPNNPVDQQAAQARNNLNSEYGAMFGRDAASNSALMDRIGAAMVTQQGNTLNQANAQRQGLLGQQTALQGQKGDFKTTYGAQLNAAQAKALMDQASLKVKQDTVNYLTGNAQSLAKDRVAGQKVARTNTRIKIQSQSSKDKQTAVKNAQWLNEQSLRAWKVAHPNTKNPGKNPGTGFTPTQVRASREQLRKTLHYLSPAIVKADPEGAKKALTTPPDKKNGKPVGNVDPLMAEAVVQMIAGGGVSRKTATDFYRAFGVHLHVNDLGEKVVGGIIKAIGKK